MKTEKLQEGWVKFRRIYCKDGFIDHWIGNSANDPNELEPSNISLSIISYFRLNGTGEWKERMWFKEDPIGMLNVGSEWNTAEEIWNYCKR
jgi:hypothetical protein